MRTLLAGASGATGRLLAAELLRRGGEVVAIVREPDRLPETLRNHSSLAVVTGSVLDMPDASLVDLVATCDAVASTLGHNLSFRGIFGKPRRLVRDSCRRLCAAIASSGPPRPIKFVLMNTAGNRNRDVDPQRSAAEEILFAALRLLVPPHIDNEQAAEFLRDRVGAGDTSIQWAAVRPDTLIDADAVSGYMILPSPTRSALFNPGRTSRINVAHFIADLIHDDATWGEWHGKMPVIYNAT